MKIDVNPPKFCQKDGAETNTSCHNTITWHSKIKTQKPVYLLITVKTNARVNTRGSKMLPTNRATAGEEVIHRLEDERSRLIIGVGL